MCFLKSGADKKLAFLANSILSTESGQKLQDDVHNGTVKFLTIVYVGMLLVKNISKYRGSP